MQPRTLDSSTNVVSATLLFSALPVLEGFPDWEPAVCAIGDVSYQTEMKFDEGLSEKTVRYIVTMHEPTNEQMQLVAMQQVIRIQYRVTADDVSLAYKHHLTSSHAWFNPTTITAEQMHMKLFVACKQVTHGY